MTLRNLYHRLSTHSADHTLSMLLLPQEAQKPLEPGGAAGAAPKKYAPWSGDRGTRHVTGSCGTVKREGKNAVNCFFFDNLENPNWMVDFMENPRKYMDDD